MKKSLQDTNSETENFTRKTRVLVNVVKQVKSGITSIGKAIEEARKEEIAKLVIQISISVVENFSKNQALFLKPAKPGGLREVRVLTPLTQ